MEGGVMDADMTLEEVWADLEEVLGDMMPERIYPEDRSWFTMGQYRERYKHSEETIRRYLDQWIARAMIETQLQRRGRHNVRCYRAVKDRRPGDKPVREYNNLLRAGASDEILDTKLAEINAID